MCQAKPLVSMLKAKAHLIHSGLRLQELEQETLTDYGQGWGEIMKRFELYYFYKNGISTTMPIGSVPLRIGILYMLKIGFLSFNVFLPILRYQREKKMFPTCRNEKAQSLTASVQGHTGLCPALTLLHEGQDAHQFFLIAVWQNIFALLTDCSSSALNYFFTS